MITLIRRKGLKLFFESGSNKGIQAGHENRLILAAPDTSTTINDTDVQGYRLHPLKGTLKGRWSVSVSGNWPVTFEFKDGNVQLLDYEGYR